MLLQDIAATHEKFGRKMPATANKYECKVNKKFEEVFSFQVQYDYQYYIMYSMYFQSQYSVIK